VRAREDARLDRMRARHRLGKFCLRHDRRMPTTCWGVTRRAWLGRQVFELPGQQQAFDDYLFAVDQIDRRIDALEGEIARIAADGPHTELIGRLRCLRGIDTLTAVGLACEVGDFRRFRTAEQFMSFVGLVPSERSSGDGRRQGDHQGRLGTRPPAARRGRLEQPPPADCRLRARAPPPRPGPRRPRALVALPAATAPPLAANGRPRQAAAEDRRRVRPRAGRSSGRSPPTSRCARPDHRPHRPQRAWGGGRSLPEAEPSLHLCGARLRRATRDARPRQLPTDTSHAVPTRECQSDPPSLPRDARHPTPAHTAPPRAGP
jgi:hypothetical protein